MKKIIVMTIVLVSLFVTAQADDYAYPYLAFVNTAGNVETLAVDDLQITFADGQLVVVNATTSKTYTLTDMAKMYFSPEDITTGISLTPSPSPKDEGSEYVYDLQGRKIADTPSSFISIPSEARPPVAFHPSSGKGIYIVRKNGQTYKVAVK